MLDLPRPLMTNIPQQSSEDTQTHTPSVENLYVGRVFIRANYMVVSQIRRPQYRPQNTIVLIMGSSKKVPIILGNPHICMSTYECYHGHSLGAPGNCSRHLCDLSRLQMLLFQKCQRSYHPPEWIPMPVLVAHIVNPLTLTPTNHSFVPYLQPISFVWLDLKSEYLLFKNGSTR